MRTLDALLDKEAKRLAEEEGGLKEDLRKFKSKATDIVADLGN